MAEFTIGERLLLHLYTHRSVNPDDYFNIPWELTQDGISSSLGISRAHTSIELKRLKEKDLIVESQVRIKGGKVRRLAYSLNEKGLKASMDLEEKVNAAGLDMKSLIDFKKQDGVHVLKSLNADDKRALGIACAFRLSVPTTVLPPHTKNVVPSDVVGFTLITPELRNKILSAASETDLADWHSFAADYYDMEGRRSVIEDEDNRTVERTYHLIKAGRLRDAHRAITNDFYAMLLSDDRGFYEAVRDIPDKDIKSDRILDFMMLRAELALSQNDLKTARESAEKLIDMEGGEEYGYACLTECLMLRNKTDEAEKMANQINGSGNSLGMLKLAEVYLDLGDLDRAEEQYSSATKFVSDNNNPAVTQKFTVLARIDKERGRPEDAERHLSKAYASTNDIGRKSLKAFGNSIGVNIRELRESDFS